MSKQKVCKGFVVKAMLKCFDGKERYKKVLPRYMARSAAQKYAELWNKDKPEQKAIVDESLGYEKEM